MNATDRLGRDMLADALVRRFTLVVTALLASFLLGLLMLSMQQAMGGVSRSVTTPASEAAPNWNAQAPQRDAVKR